MDTKNKKQKMGQWLGYWLLFLMVLAFFPSGADAQTCVANGGVCSPAGCASGWTTRSGSCPNTTDSCCVQSGASGGAAGLVPCGNGSAYEDRCTLCHLVVGIKGLIDYGFKILVFVALLMLVVAGVMYIVSAGNTEMINSAKGIMKNTLYGFAFVLGAWLIINYAMIILGTKSNLGIERVTGSWSNFSCSSGS